MHSTEPPLHYSDLTLRPSGPSPRIPEPSHASLIAHFRLDRDVSPLFPYINAIVDGAAYYDHPLHIQFNLDDFHCCLLPREGTAGMCEGFPDAQRLLSRLMAFLEEIESRKGGIRPNPARLSRTPILEIYKLLPGVNCGECGHPTCMAFAAALSLQQAHPTDCPNFVAPMRQQAVYPVYDAEGNVRKTVAIPIDATSLARSLRATTSRIEELERQLARLTRANESSAAEANTALPVALTSREIQVLQLMGRGATNAEISELLRISPHTVKSHVIHIFNKLGVCDRTEASVWAARQGLL
jgi:DNA-binding NarL/FixJ family response regulator